MSGFVRRVKLISLRRAVLGVPLFWRGVFARSARGRRFLAPPRLFCSVLNER
jgi:hypothetical protein